MGQFFKTVAAVVLGIFLFTIIGFFILIGIVAGVNKEKKVEISSNSVLLLDVNYLIKEQTVEGSLSYTDLSALTKKTYGLTDLTKAISKAKNDNNIKGIYLPLGAYMNGMATTEVLRDALIDFKKSGKFVISYGDIATQKSYYLASVADKIYMNPKGFIELSGFGTRLTFFKGLLDKLGIEVQAFHRGKFKSAFDPFVRTEVSEANRDQITALLTDVYSHFLDKVSASRHINRTDLNMYIDSLMIQNPGDAYRYKMIDGVRYYDEVLAEMAEKSGISKDAKLNFVKLKEYNETPVQSAVNFSNANIAVVYAQGDIVDGQGTDDNIGGDKYASIFRKLRTDDNIKAVVLRINSGGGSALASEVIWREVELTNKQKPVIVSFGDVAASGGYYIACPGSRIFAQANSITGSIGVFGLIPNAKGLFADKLGITFDEVKITKHSVTNAGIRPLDDFESKVIQRNIDSTYETFLNRVATGRRQSFNDIEEKAEGRVWSGKAAIKIGLVDELGGLNEAINYAIKKSNSKDYKVIEYPEEKDLMNKVLDGINDEAESKILEKEFGAEYKQLVQLKELLQTKSIQARMPYILDIN